MFSKRTVGKIKWLYFFTGIRRLQPSCQFVVARGVPCGVFVPKRIETCSVCDPFATTQFNRVIE